MKLTNFLTSPITVTLVSLSIFRSVKLAILTVTLYSPSVIAPDPYVDALLNFCEVTNRVLMKPFIPVIKIYKLILL